MGFLSDIFDSFTNQQATPKQTIIPTNELLSRGYDTATGLAPQVQALNNAYQPIITGNQLNSENQVFGSAANQVQRGAYQSVLDNLNLGNSVPQDLQDLVTTNTLQQLGRSGIGTADAGKLFGARSLLSAGLDLGRQRQQDALSAANLLPSSRITPQVQGIPNPNEISGMIDQEQSARDDYDNRVENIRRENFSSLINTGGRILGMVAGGVATGGSPMGIIAGGNIGGALGGKTGVAGYGTNDQGSDSEGFTSILKGLFGTKGGVATPGFNGRPDSVTAGTLPFNGLFA